LDTKRYI